MSGKSKSNYLTITQVEGTKHITLLQKMFFNVADMNKFIKNENIVEKYPKPQYIIYKEYY